MRIRGSHHVYARVDAAIRISVPVHGDTPLKVGLQSRITKLADIDESEL
jgi:predicted RNA binding protein YcfA (HicA-like mRNA interferase family)